MVFFKDFSSSNKLYLAILNDETESLDEATSLPIHRPLKGPFSDKWTKLEGAPHVSDWSFETPPDSEKGVPSYFLRSPIHSSAPLARSYPSLGRRIISKEVKWGNKLIFGGQFTFVAKYWEWAEYVLGHYTDDLEKVFICNAVRASMYTYDRDSNIMRAFCEAWCPSTNTLHTAAGELSISLWDLRLIGGLPIRGDFYEEVIPSAKEFSAVSEKTGQKVIPPSCEYLFQVFHYLCRKAGRSSSVSVSEWIEFWFRGDRKYDFTKPRTYKRKRVTRPRHTHNPSGNFEVNRKLSLQEETVFDDLGIDGALREQTYLAAFISCWLCVFALPITEPNVIRPGTFKAASILAHGHEFSLAVPVLASIYKGLRDISTSERPWKSHFHFPIHYVFGWLACYFDTHYYLPEAAPSPRMARYSGEGGAKYFEDREARELIHSGAKAVWHSTMYTKNRKEMWIDDGRLSFLQLSYFTSVCSCYLVLRQDNSILVEPYSPNRFSRQFGFCQDVPGDLKRNVRSASPKDAINFWRVCMRRGTMSHVTLPACPEDLSTHTTQSFRSWWSGVHGSYLSDGVDILIDSVKGSSGGTKRSKKRRYTSDSDVESEHEDSGDDGDDGDDFILVSNQRLKNPLTDEPHLHSSTLPQSSKYVSHGDACDSERPLEKVGNSNAQKDVASPGSRKTASSLYRIELSDVNFNTFLDGVPSSSQPIADIGAQLGKCNYVVADDDQTLEAADFDSEGSVSVANRHSSAGVRAEHFDEDASHSIGLIPRCAESTLPKPNEATNVSCSSYCPRNSLSSFRRRAIYGLGMDLLKELKMLPLHRVEKIREITSSVYQGITDLKGDPTHLKSLVDAYIGSVTAYLKFSEQFKGRSTTDEVAVKREEAMKKLESAKSTYDNSVASLAESEQERNDLEEQLRLLQEKASRVKEALKTKNSVVEEAKRDMDEAQKLLSDVDSIPVIPPEEVIMLQELKETVSTRQAAIEPSTWMDMDA